ncbi:hypothetical protein [Aliiroseovarius crassostreae]|uniref:hypothetical protein n=1 Tax=Aliiroseovarius crassostreae TaxID=154981 RepID=UPI003C7AB5A6
MTVLRYIIGLFAALLFSALGAVSTPLVPLTSTQAGFFPHHEAAPADYTNVNFAARAPPIIGGNITFTGVAVAEQGNGFTMHGHATHVASLSFGADFDATNRGIDGIWDQGRFTPIQRGNAIEDHLAGTDYNGWTRVGSQDNGFSPAWDFNQGSTWVSLKTVNTGGSGWQTAMRSHIRELEIWSSPTNPNAAKVLDIRVQPGGATSAQSLIDYGASRGVQVRINEF